MTVPAQTNTRGPNFFLVGAPKAGTTSLYRYLAQHPQIYMSPIKEPHYFATEIRVENFDPHTQRMARHRNRELKRYFEGPVTRGIWAGPVEDWNCYLKLFRAATNEVALGEASTCYLWSPTAAHAIAARFPGSRILMVLRNPVDRAFSQYRHMLSFARSGVTLTEHIERGFSSRGPLIGETWPFLHFGLYSAQIPRYFRHFSREQIHIAFYDDLVRDPASFIASIYGFLGVDSSFKADTSQRYMDAAVPRSHVLNRRLRSIGVWQFARDVSPPPIRRRFRRFVYRSNSSLAMTTEERRRLASFYRDDIQRLSLLVRRDLSAWLS
jgi:hypothetical protein